MTERCENCGGLPEGCQCSFCDSDCLEVGGNGSEEQPFGLFPRLEGDPFNLVPTGDNLFSYIPGEGMRVRLPDHIRSPGYIRATRGSNQPIPDRELTPISFSTTRFSGGGMSVSGSRIGIPRTGVYIIAASVRWEGRAGGRRRLVLRRNGSLALMGSEQSTDQSDEFNMCMSTLDSFKQGEFIELYVRHNTGSSLDVLTSTFSPDLALVFKGQL